MDRSRRGGSRPPVRPRGRHDLASADHVRSLVSRAGIERGHLVVDVGAGNGAITAELVDAGANVVAIELDRIRLTTLRSRFADRPVAVVGGDLRRVRFPAEPYRIVANPPFHLTTDLLARLLDRPDRGPGRGLVRADLVLQRAAARRFADDTTAGGLRWAPWFELEVVASVPRRAFRPTPAVDAAVLVVRRRPTALLPADAAPAWQRFVAAEASRRADPDRALRWWLRRFRRASGHRSGGP